MSRGPIHEPTRAALRDDDDSRDLHVRAEPQGELAPRRAGALRSGNDVDAAPLDRPQRGRSRGLGERGVDDMDPLLHT